MSTTLSTIQKFFPEVVALKDAKRPITIEVTKGDVIASKKRNHKECAMAVACKRKFKADGVVISRTIAYLVHKKHATRFSLPPSVGREVTSFDRGGGFEPGTYTLSKPVHRLGSRGGNSLKTGRGRPIQLRHVTANIRAVLGGFDPGETA